MPCFLDNKSLTKQIQDLRKHCLSFCKWTHIQPYVIMYLNPSQHPFHEACFCEVTNEILQFNQTHSLTLAIKNNAVFSPSFLKVILIIYCCDYAHFLASWTLLYAFTIVFFTTVASHQLLRAPDIDDLILALFKFIHSHQVTVVIQI